MTYELTNARSDFRLCFSMPPAPFCLHETEVKSPPFEVTEMGWGEFEAKMTLHFKDPQEKPVDILHQLRLYHDAAAGTTQPKKASPLVPA